MNASRSLSFTSAIAVTSGLLVLGACASVDNRTGAEKFSYSASDAEMSVLVLSVGAADKCVSFVTRLKLLPAEARYSAKPVASVPVDSYVVKSEYTDHHGYLHVLRVKPGSYYFTPYVNNPSLHTISASRADFTVSAGEIVYLGEYYLQQACGMSTSGVYRDQSERDMALLRTKNPDLAQAKIQKRILKFTGKVVL